MASGQGFVHWILSGHEKARGIMQKWYTNAGHDAAVALQQAAEETLVPYVRQAAEDGNLRFRNKLIPAIGTEIVENKGRALVLMGAIGIPHATAVELGQKPGTTQDEQTLIEYARIKLGVDGPAATNIGKRLKERIEKGGSEAHPFLLPVFKRQESAFAARFTEIMRQRYQQGG